MSKEHEEKAMQLVASLLPDKVDYHSKSGVVIAAGDIVSTNRGIGEVLPDMDSSFGYHLFVRYAQETVSLPSILEEGEVEIVGNIFDNADLLPHYTESAFYMQELAVISGWEELEKCQSGEYKIEGVEMYSTWITNLISLQDTHYFSTHTFYESQFKASTCRMRQLGFNVILKAD